MIPTVGCALANLVAGEDPVATATPFDQLFLIQVPPPWERIALDSATVPAEVRRALVPAAQAKQRAYVLLIDGDAPLADQEMRVLFYRKPGGPAGPYVASEFLVPRHATAAAIEALSTAALISDAASAHVAAGAEVRGSGPAAGASSAVDAMAAASGGPEATALASMPSMRRLPDPGRDLFICTHGERDGCCGTFGEAAYQHLTATDLPRGTRAWRISHFGGHRFAPTLVDLPTGRVWGKLNQTAMDAILARLGGVADLRSMYRGWSALHPAGQFVERELFMEHGWSWLGARVDVAIEERHVERHVERHEERHAARHPERHGHLYRVELEATLEPGAAIRTEAEIVERTPLVLPLSCGADESVVPQYAFAAMPRPLSGAGARG